MKSRRESDRAKRIAGVIIVVTVLVIAVLYQTEGKRVHMVQRRYEESRRILQNPDRGWYVQADIQDAYAYQKDFEPQLRLRLLTMNLQEYHNIEDLPEEKLRQLRQALESYRELGVGVIFRAGYGFADKIDTEPKKFETVLNHCRQICSVLNEYTDVVLVMQAGFIGPYGEWHTSPYMEEEKITGEKYYLKLLKWIEEQLDEKINIGVRRPMFLREAEAAGMDLSRFAVHNDAFLSTPDDMGTYVEEGYDRKKELNWMQKNLANVVNGGETTNISSYSRFKNAIKEMEQMNVTYLNGFYNQEVLKEWKNATYNDENGYSYIANHLGYRLYLKEIKLQAQVKKRQQLKLSGVLENTGFATPQKSYQWYIVVKGKERQRYLPLEVNGTEDEIIFSQKLDLWNIAPEEETVQIGFCLSKDKNRSGKYSVELANDAFTYENGVNWVASYTKESTGIWPNTWQFVLKQQ